MVGIIKHEFKAEKNGYSILSAYMIVNIDDF